ncbi:hypothetical protein WEI85_30780 [Actinomycetes bacterium KLBMP 9797]
MLRNRLAKLLLATSVVALGMFGASTAAHAATPHAAAPAVTSADVGVLSQWFFFDRYATKAECKAMGEDLMDSNFIYNYSCQYRNGRYELYVQYNE